MTLASTTATITAENNFCSSIMLDGNANLTISGTWEATVTVQKSFDNSNWADVATYTANTVQIINEPEYGVYWRAGVKTGGFTSGTVVIRISY